MRSRCVADFLLDGGQATESEESTSRPLEHDRRRFFALGGGGGDRRIDAPERAVDFVARSSFVSASESESESQVLSASSLRLALHAFNKC